MIIQPPVYEGFLYRITNDQGKEMGHLLGTVHATIDEKYTLNPNIEKACKKSDTIFFEIDFTKIPDVKMRDDACKRLLQEHPFESIEAKIMRIAIENQKNIKGLESFEVHMQTLNKIRNLSAGADIKSYKTGNKNIYKIFSHAQDKKIFQKAIWDRNRMMADKINESLQNQENPFIAIGSDHLWGTKESTQKGVIALLRDKGWKVEKANKVKNGFLTKIANKIYELFFKIVIFFIKPFKVQETNKIAVG